MGKLYSKHRVKSAVLIKIPHVNQYSSERVKELSTEENLFKTNNFFDCFI